MATYYLNHELKTEAPTTADRNAFAETTWFNTLSHINSCSFSRWSSAFLRDQELIQCHKVTCLHMQISSFSSP